MGQMEVQVGNMYMHMDDQNRGRRWRVAPDVQRESDTDGGPLVAVWPCPLRARVASAPPAVGSAFPWAEEDEEEGGLRPETRE